MPKYICLLVVLLSVFSGNAQEIFLNELAPSVTNSQVDNYGEFEDWIELYNCTKHDINLAGWYLSDNPDKPLKWRIPSINPKKTTILAGDYLIFWADKDTLQGPEHLGFSLKKKGEYLFLYRPSKDGPVLEDSVKYGTVIADHSFGRCPDKSSEWTDFKHPTPGKQNICVADKKKKAKEIPLPAPPDPLQNSNIKAMHNQLLSEQDVDSPHRYERDGWGVRDGDVVVDAGAAEGFFALSVIDRARRVVLVESSPEWLSALQETFAPFPGKAVFVQRLITGEPGDSRITLDEIMRMEGGIDFVKADIEGGELAMLKGGSATLTQTGLRLAVAAYHRKDDAAVISGFLEQQDFVSSFSPRLILVEDFEDGRLALRHGICYAEKKSGIIPLCEQ